MIRAIVIRRTCNYLNIVPDDALHDIRDLEYTMIFIARVKYLAINCRILIAQRSQVKITHICDMDIWPHLLSTKNGDLLIIYSMIGQDIDCKIKPQTRRIAAYFRRTQNKRCETRN